jgi:hypothetical protein
LVALSLPVLLQNSAAVSFVAAITESRVAMVQVNDARSYLA